MYCVCFWFHIYCVSVVENDVAKIFSILDNLMDFLRHRLQYDIVKVVFLPIVSQQKRGNVNSGK